MGKTIIILLTALLCFCFLGCRKDSDDLPTDTQATTEESQTATTSAPSASSGTESQTEGNEDGKMREIEPSDLVPIESGHPVLDVEDDSYDIFARHDKGDVIGHGNTFCIRTGGEYFLIFDIGTPVSEYGNVSLYDIDGNGIDEIIVYDFSGRRTGILAYNDEGSGFSLFLIPGLVYINDYGYEQGYKLFMMQTETYPYGLFIYYFDGTGMSELDVSKATGSEYSVLAEGRYIFAGSKDSLVFYIVKDGELIGYDPSLYMISRSIFADGGSALLGYDDLRRTEKYYLRLGIEEIHARNGYVFEDEFLDYYFRKMPWYIPDETYERDMLTKNQAANINLIELYLASLEENVRIYDEMAAQTDLNGDGIGDSITLEVDDYNYRLTVNGTAVEASGDMLINKLFIFDISKGDGYFEIGVSEAGPSDDYATDIYRYDGNAVTKIGRVEGTGESMSIEGNGTVWTYRRGRVLQTWFYTYSFMMDETGILHGIDEDEYMMNTFVMMKKDLDVYTLPDGLDVGFTLKEGDPALIVSSDDRSFCRVRSHTGEEGFFLISSFADINDTGLQAWDYFDGLSYAD